MNVIVFWEDGEHTVFIHWPTAIIFVPLRQEETPSEACSCIQSPAGLQFTACPQKLNDGKYLQPVYGNWSAPQGEKNDCINFFFQTYIVYAALFIVWREMKFRAVIGLGIGQSNPIRAPSTPPSSEQNYTLINRLEINLLDGLLFYQIRGLDWSPAMKIGYRYHTWDDGDAGSVEEENVQCKWKTDGENKFRAFCCCCSLSLSFSAKDTKMIK